MVFHDKFLSSASGLFEQYSSLIYIVGGAAFFIAIIEFSRRNREEYGTSGEAREIAKGGYGLALMGWTGRKLWGTLKWGVRSSIQLGKFAYRAGKKGGKLGKDFGQYASRLIEGEKANISLELHEIAASSASVELATVMGKLVNAEFDEHRAKYAIGLHLRALDFNLAKLPNIENIDIEARKFIVDIGQKMTQTLIELAHHETLEVNVRKKSFAEAYRLIRLVRVAEKLALSIENKALSNQDALSRFNTREIVDLEKYINDRLEREYQNVRKAKEALGSSASADQATRAELLNQIRIAQKNVESIRPNVNRLLEILSSLKGINDRMLRTIEKIRNDIREALNVISRAVSDIRNLEAKEAGIEKKAEGIKAKSKSAESNLASMQNEDPEKIIIGLTLDAGSIMNGTLEISRSILDIDGNILSPIMQELMQAMEKAYKVEEASRVADSFYAKVMNANKNFYNLVIGTTDFMQEVKDTFTQEIKIEEMESQIAAREANVAQAAKSLFIRTINIIGNTIGKIAQHIEYLRNNIALTESTRNYTLGVLRNVLEIMSSHKQRVNKEWAQKAEVYQRRLNVVNSQLGLVRMARAA